MKMKAQAAVWIILVIVLIILVGGGIYLSLSGTTNTGTSGSQSGDIISEGSSEIPSNGNNDVNEMIVSNEYGVDIANFAYSPPTLTIKVGDIVTWTNQDSVGHTVTSDSGSEMDSALLFQGQSYSHTFTAKGTYEYHCTPHPNMKGKIVVE